MTKPDTSVLRAAVYARFSTNRQDPSSIEAQERLCRAAIADRGWHAHQTFADHAITGTVSKRPGYQALLAAIRAKGLDVVVVENFSRLSRDEAELHRLYKLTSFHDVRLLSLAEGEASEEKIAIYALLNGHQVKHAQTQTHRTLSDNVARGRIAGGRRYGYRRPVTAAGQILAGELEIVEEQAEVIRRIFRLYADGASPHTIAATLNAEGVPSPRGTSWSQSTINGNRAKGNGIVNNELYRGIYVWNRLQFRRDPDTEQRVPRARPEQDAVRVELPHLRIVDEDLWDAVKARQRSLDTRRAARETGDRTRLSGSQSVRRPQYLLSHRVKCGFCGGGMAIAGSHTRRFYCSNHKYRGPTVCKGQPGLRKDALEHLVLAGLRRDLVRPEAVAAFAAAYETERRARTAQASQRHDYVRRQLADKVAAIAGLLDLVKAGARSPSLVQELESLEREKAALEAQLDDVPPPPAPPLVDAAEVYRERVRLLVHNLDRDAATRAQAADALRGLIACVTVRWDATASRHVVDVEGDIVALLIAGGLETQNAASISRAACSLKLVAGAGFEPATFRL